MTLPGLVQAEPPPGASPSASPALGPGRRSRRGTPRQVLRRILLYSASRGTTEALLGVRGIVLASLLGPAAFGAWALLRLAVRYSSLAGLGVNRGLELVLMQHASHSAPHPGAGTLGTPGAETIEKDLAARTAFGFVLAVFVPLSLLALGASFLVADPERALVLRGFAAAIIVEQVYAQSLVRLRAAGGLRGYATIEVAQAAMQVVCCCLLAFVWGLGGAFVGLVIAGVLSIVWMPGRVALRPTLARRPLRRLLGVGAPLVVSTMLAFALGSADRWVVAAAIGTTQLGYYAFAASAAGIAASLALVIRVVIIRDVYADAGSASAPAALRRHLERAVLPFARLYPPALGALALAIGPVVALLLPRYVEAIPPARIFILTGAAAGLVSLATVGAVAAGRQRALPLITGVALLANLGLSALAIHAGAGLEGVALSSLLGQLIFAAGVLALGADAAGGRAGSAERGRRLLPEALFPLIWCAGALLILGRFLPGHDPTSVLASAVLYLVLMLPLAPALRQELRKLRG